MLKVMLKVTRSSVFSPRMACRTNFASDGWQDGRKQVNQPSLVQTKADVFRL
jgi:hypothetical protein